MQSLPRTLDRYQQEVFDIRQDRIMPVEQSRKAVPLQNASMAEPLRSLAIIWLLLALNRHRFSGGSYHTGRATEMEVQSSAANRVRTERVNEGKNTALCQDEVFFD